MEGLLLLVAVLLPAASGILVMLLPRLSETRENRCWFVGAVMVLECIVVALVALDGEKTLILFNLTKELPIALHSDGTSRIFSLVMAMAVIVLLAVGADYMECQCISNACMAA